MKPYTTIATLGEAGHIDRRSRFLGRAKPVTSEEEAVSFIKSLREAERDASHHCYAYRLRENNLSRHSDDGEPQGTAGLPIMDVLAKGELTDLAVVVTRWFGGTLLGTGGLVRAYTRAAKEAVTAGGVAVMTPCDLVAFRTHYRYKERIEALCAEHRGAVLGLDYGQDLFWSLSLPEAQAAGFTAAVTELTLGESRPEKTGNEFRAVKKEEFGDELSY
ncbi:MAG TPA: YigZ family protein [Candidatus Acidoferrum sp.]|nr:YigZ family protein [Candidatus Acidoferrum sp.]